MQSNFVCLCRFFFENLSILRANEIKINGIIPLCIGPQDYRKPGRPAGGHWSSQISWPYLNHGGQIMPTRLLLTAPPGFSDLPTALGRPQLASTIDTSQDESECLRGRRPPKHIDALYQNLVWFQGRPEAALPCPALSAWLILVVLLKSIRSQETDPKGFFRDF